LSFFCKRGTIGNQGCVPKKKKKKKMENCK